MADKSVIQMSADRHGQEGSAALISALHMPKLQSAAPMTANEAAAYAAGFELAWKLSELCARREGNCKFEGGR